MSGTTTYQQPGDDFAGSVFHSATLWHKIVDCTFQKVLAYAVFVARPESFP